MHIVGSRLRERIKARCRFYEIGGKGKIVCSLSKLNWIKSTVITKNQLTFGHCSCLVLIISHTLSLIRPSPKRYSTIFIVTGSSSPPHTPLYVLCKKNSQLSLLTIELSLISENESQPNSFVKFCNCKHASITFMFCTNLKHIGLHNIPHLRSISPKVHSTFILKEEWKIL